MHTVIHQHRFRTTYKNQRAAGRGFALPALFRRERILLAGSGQVAQEIIKSFNRLHFNATLRPEGDMQAKRLRLSELGARPIVADLSNPIEIKRLASLGRKVIWLAPPNSLSSDDTSISRWVLARKARFPSMQKDILTYVSTTGVYGNAQGEWIDELCPTNPQSERAVRRVAVENRIKHAVRCRQLRASILRAPGIYSHSRLPIERLKNGTPAICVEEDSYSNHIHELDLARLCMWAIHKAGAWRVINACDSMPIKMGDYFDAVAEATGLRKPLRLPREEVKTLVSPMMWSFMRESRKIKSLGIPRLGFVLRYPSVHTCLQEVAATLARSI